MPLPSYDATIFLETNFCHMINNSPILKQFLISPASFQAKIVILSHVQSALLPHHVTPTLFSVPWHYCLASLSPPPFYSNLARHPGDTTRRTTATVRIYAQTHFFLLTPLVIQRPTRTKRFVQVRHLYAPSSRIVYNNINLRYKPSDHF